MNKKSVFWEVYFWFIIICFVGALGFLVLNEEDVFLTNNYSRMFDVFFLIVIIISSLGIRGYRHEKKYFSKEIWIFFFFLILVDSINYLFFEYNYFFLKNISYLSLSVILFPWYFALYKYTFKMNELWGTYHNY
ncbi:MAG: hypothetical protein PHG81_11020 [Aliarcobacter sp.]|nr:hypothetical protein [Aliarcobacter sp.]